jgi:hypothetical protein
VNPIKVRRATRPVWDTGRVTWLWECRLCGRRAYHRSNRMSDRYRQQLGKTPDRHPRERAIEGGLAHLHRKHTPCTCCATGEHHNRFTNQEVNS